VKINDTDIAGLKLVNLAPYGDVRGSFCRLYSKDEFSILPRDRQIVQINHSVTLQQGTVRGMHYQLPPYAEFKIIRCLKGKVFDVAVDLRAGSPTFRHWHGVVLDSTVPQLYVIPEGVAHGFQTLQDKVELLYMHSSEYSPQNERRFHHGDDSIAISWPETVSEISLIDAEAPCLGKNFGGVVLV